MRKEEIIEEKLKEENFGVVNSVECSDLIIQRCAVISAPDHALPDFIKVILAENNAFFKKDSSLIMDV